MKPVRLQSIGGEGDKPVPLGTERLLINGSLPSVSPHFSSKIFAVAIYGAVDFKYI